MESKYTGAIQEAYNGFNNRDIDGVFSVMTSDVHWPKAFEGGHVQGQQAVRDYWEKQWNEINPKVTPAKITERPDGKVAVLVSQLVKDLDGNILFDGTTTHVYTFQDDLISRMDIE